jgi:threonine dehydrogenase-like Zn-dependent dehydrogenase
MKAAVWHGKRDVRVDTMPDPTIQKPDDIVIKVTSSGICGSDLHLYEAGDHHGKGRRPRSDPVQHQLRALRHVPPGTDVAMRDHSGTRSGQRPHAVVTGASSTSAAEAMPATAKAEMHREQAEPGSTDSGT